MQKADVMQCQRFRILISLAQFAFRAGPISIVNFWLYIALVFYINQHLVCRVANYSKFFHSVFNCETKRKNNIALNLPYK